MSALTRLDAAQGEIARLRALLNDAAPLVRDAGDDEDPDARRRACDLAARIAAYLALPPTGSDLASRLAEIHRKLAESAADLDEIAEFFPRITRHDRWSELRNAVLDARSDARGFHQAALEGGVLR